MSLLYGLSLIVFPIAEFAGGHIYQVGGYGTVYVISLFICFCGLLYVIMVVPDESMEDIHKNKQNKRDQNKSDEPDQLVYNKPQKDIKLPFNNHQEKSRLLTTVNSMFLKGNKAIIESYR